MDARWTSFALWGLGLLWSGLFGAFAAASWQEGERRAVRVALALAAGGGLLLGAGGLLPPIVRAGLLGLAGLSGAVFAALFFLPIGKVALGNDVPSRRFDERMVMFARARLQPGTPNYEAYYRQHPEHKAGDDSTRAHPGLLSPRARFANPFLFAAAAASFEVTEALHQIVDGPPAPRRETLSSEAMTAYLKSLARYYGALDVGVTELRPYHVYSHIGRGPGEWGAPITLAHTYALAFTVEMDFAVMGAAPHAPVVAESARQYTEAARVAVQVAAALRNLGYAARAHIDANYRVIAPLVARDAGLGEFGRMSILMTPRQGARVRVGVVTTDAPLIPDKRDLRFAAAVVDFCNICMKCAETCPTRSISFNPRQEVDDALRWRINPDTCFRYWNVVGTDCGRCMSVCPFSHPDTAFHNAVRWGISRSGFFRRVALWMDDLFYGRRPPTKAPPAWMQVDAEE